MAPGIDLHTHSTASDGTLSPAELVTAARTAGLDVVALTDHDTTAGWAPAAAALPGGLTLVGGAELSCVHDGISVHLLAYLFDPADPALAAERRAVRESRTDRARRIVQLLRADGHPVDWPEIVADAQGTIGRPHIARALVRHGLVSSVDQAFAPAWLGDHGRYWVSKRETDVLTAIRLVREAGGVPVFAHPLATRRGPVVGAETVAAMAAAGLAGLEADHPDHDAAQRARLRALAADLDLVVTGSSDFHGSNKGVRLGELRTAPEAYEALLARARGGAPVVG